MVGKRKVVAKPKGKKVESFNPLAIADKKPIAAVANAMANATVDVGKLKEKPSKFFVDVAAEQVKRMKRFLGKLTEKAAKEIGQKAKETPTGPVPVLILPDEVPKRKPRMKKPG